MYYRSNDGSENTKVEVTRETKIIDGVECVVVLDRVFNPNGKLIEKTFDYYAQDLDGNVWYFGEDSKNYVHGVFQDTEARGSPELIGAEPGIIMKAAPVVGESYTQENAPGIAADAATVLSLDASAHTPYGSFDPTLKTFEFSPLEPALKEQKFYAAGVGFVRAKDLADTGQGEKLVRIEVNGTSADDTIDGNIGRDVLRGHDGNDALRELRGDDTLVGGIGADHLAGGGGRDVFQFDLAKESGKAAAARDTISDFRAGNDTIRSRENRRRSRPEWRSGLPFHWRRALPRDGRRTPLQGRSRRRNRQGRREWRWRRRLQHQGRRNKRAWCERLRPLNPDRHAPYAAAVA